MPLLYPWRTAYGEDYVIESVLVRMGSGDLAGWGEATPLASPNYSPEWAAGVYILVRDWLAPRLLEQDIESATQLQEKLAMIQRQQLRQGCAGHRVVGSACQERRKAALEAFGRSVAHRGRWR